MEVAHDKTKLKVHFEKYHHGATLEQYYRDHVAKTGVKAPSEKRRTSEQATNVENAKRARPTDSVSSSSAVATPDETAAWYDGCIYQCEFCPLQRSTVQTIKQHLRQYHKKRDLRPDQGFETIKEDRIECALCGVSVRKNMCDIKSHLSSKHRGEKMSFEEYEAKFVHGGGAASEEDSVPRTREEDVPEVIFEYVKMCFLPTAKP